MSYLATDKLAIRLREVLEAGYGSARTITAATYGGNLPDGLTEMGDSTRSVGQPQVEATITGVKPSASGHAIIGSVLLYDVDVRVRVVRQVQADLLANGAARDVVKAAASTDADVLRQALSWPGNLMQTHAGDATGLCSGMLMHRESRVEMVPAVEDGAATISTEHLFHGVMKSAPS